MNIGSSHKDLCEEPMLTDECPRERRVVLSTKSRCVLYRGRDEYRRVLVSSCVRGVCHTHSFRKAHVLG